ncbi:hypothetical protein [Streptomyces sp. NRRL F-5123]|uniref:hypothetical protein n=1 Tax=Streptomyces sp. NRRL F-5123 TaxID=1463856 RepID=UPI0004E13AAD|nr:hypothetical protein [Streptomyces sp. NRRL F-5123]
MAAERASTAQPRCHRCGRPVARGGALHIPVDHGTSASPDVLWHRSASDCGPAPHVRRTT